VNSPVFGSEGEKLRVIIETDIGGDPDDQASLVRWLVYSNEWDIEGIITTRPPGSRQGHGYEIARGYIDAYGEVVNNLSLHNTDYPAKQYLMERFKDGMPSSDDGRDLIISVIDKDDPRPVWYSNWGCDDGTTSSLKRALDKIKTERSTEEYNKFVSKIRLTAELGQRHFNGHTTAFPLYLDTFFPDMDGGRWYHRWEPLTATAGGFDINRDVKNDHGPLGTLYTIQKEGDTPVFMYLIPNGLEGHVHPSWGTWSGRFGPRDQDFTGPSFWWANVRDTWQGSTRRDNTLKRWAVHLQNDFRARMDWCVKSFAGANHEPEPVVNGYTGSNIVSIDAIPGATVLLSTAGSADPDGDPLSYEWVYYKEAGTYNGDISISNPTSENVSVTLPQDFSDGDTIHVLLIATDNGSPQLTRYRRILITKQIIVDDTPPTTPTGVNANPVSEFQIDIIWQAASDPDSSISGYKVYRNGILIGQPNTSFFSDRGLSESTTYNYEVTSLNGAGLESPKSGPVSATTPTDTTPPSVTSVIARGSPTNVIVVFSEAVEESSATRVTNYSIDQGIAVLGASLGADLRTVTLSTSSHIDGLTYRLTVSNVQDRAGIPNVLAPNTQVNYTFVAQLTISNLTVASGRYYVVMPDGLNNGASVYSDRSYTYTSVPDLLEGATYIKTANDDKESSGSSFINFHVNQDVTVYVAHDDRIAAKPSWLQTFTDTGDDLVTTNCTFSLFTKDLSAGTITLGGNGAAGDGSSMYAIIVVGQGASLPPHNTSPSAPSGLKIVGVQ